MNKQQWAVALTVLGGACGPGGETTDVGVEAVRREIRGGSPSSADPAVVAMAVRAQGGYEQFCTGTLVGAKTVLTAAHCVNSYGAGSFYYVLFGANADAPTKAVHVGRQVAHPSYRGDTHDFGILQLDEIVTGVTPIELNTTALTGADVGRTIRHVGYGTTDGANGSGPKRTVSFPVRSVSTYLLESGASGRQTCGGDSGGPGFMTFGNSTTEVVAGVVSFGDEDCLDDGYDGRVDVVAPWAKQTMSPWEVPTCLDDGKCVAQGCTPIDPDCACVADGQCTADCVRPSKDPDCPANCDADGVCSSSLCPRPDVDCIADGNPCQAETQCRGRVCTQDPQHPTTYCSAGCRTNTECPQGLECSNYLCRFPQLPERAPADSCTAETFCTDGRVCNGPSGGITRCVAPCTSSRDCPGATDTCEGGAAGGRFCRPPPSVLSFDPPVIALAPREYPAQNNCSSSAAGPAIAGLVLLALRRRRAR